MAAASRANDTNNKIIKEGFLMKESSFWKKNRQRWMVLTQGKKLFSFKNQIDYKLYAKQKRKKQNPTEIFELTVYNKIKTTTGGQQYQFEIISKDSIRHFIANSYYEMEDWIAKIQSVQQFVQTEFDGKNERVINDPEYYNRL
eukprot:533760_1